MTNRNVSDSIKIIASITICLFAGFLGSVFTTPAIPTWYATLIKPSFAPPNWVFFPVWTTLFVMMGISLYLVWRNGLEDKQVKKALVIFAVQLILNVLWSAVFFGFRSPSGALVEIFVLWISIVFTIRIFMKVSRTAGLLLLPYLIWVSFAAFLNFMIWRLNS
ncbi:MAG: TspO protein [Candidatus Methanoperedenaceae archaeon]|nr:MAG: TspO protein [Candidatus Methanoperedenaceae archaeon]